MTMKKNLTLEEQVAYRKHKAEVSRLWQINNPEAAAARKKQWYLANREACIKKAAERKRRTAKPREVLTDEQRLVKRKQYMRDYYKANKQIIINRWLTAKKEYMLDPLFRTKESVRQRVNSSLIRKGYSKKSKTFQILGCTFDELVIHFEKQFTDGMTWDNRNDWHIDHIVPVSIARNEDEIIKLNHYTNLRPLFAQDNFEKSDAMLDEFVPLRQSLLGW